METLPITISPYFVIHFDDIKRLTCRIANVYTIHIVAVSLQFVGGQGGLMPEENIEAGMLSMKWDFLEK